MGKSRKEPLDSRRNHQMKIGYDIERGLRRQKKQIRSFNLCTRKEAQFNAAFVLTTAYLTGRTLIPWCTLLEKGFHLKR